MKQKANRKSGSVKSMRNLPAKAVKAKTAKSIKGGVNENVSISYGEVRVQYKPQQ